MAKKKITKRKQAQKKQEQDRRSPPRRFGVFEGVFTPTVLSILGVIMYLRLGFIVGSVGLAGTVIIILLAVSITVSTAMSMSSISSNIQIGSGGVYSIISKSLGLEVGGSIGFPLYLAYVFSVTLYLFGFTEAVLYLFPGLVRLHVLGAVFLLLFLTVAIDTRIAIRTQFIVLMVTTLSLGSIFLGSSWLSSPITVSAVSDFPIPDFWFFFALFFPAVTGITAGIGMSGELKDPQKDIPRGMMFAIAITTLVYLLMATLFAQAASSAQLISNYLIVLDFAFWSPIGMAGILTATFASALTTFVAAPRVLQTMALHKILPRGSRALSKLSQRGDPQYATLLTAVLVGAILLVGNLNAVAPIITIFFLVTYMMIHTVVFIEQSLGLITFRPTVKVPKFVPLYGALASIVVMFQINPSVALGAFAFVLSVYIWLMKQNIQTPWSDARSGLLTLFSEWSSKQIARLEKTREHSWKPNILLPVLRSRTLTGNFSLIRSILFPNGTMTVLGIKLQSATETPVEHQGKNGKKLEGKGIRSGLAQLPILVKKFGDQGIFVSSTTIHTGDYTRGVGISMQAMSGLVFRPNIVFLPFDIQTTENKAIKHLLKIAKMHEIGVLIFDLHPELGLGSEKDIHVWLPRPESWDIHVAKQFDLSMLVAYKLKLNWAGKINVWMCAKRGEKKEAEKYLRKLLYVARMPETDIHVRTESFRKAIHESPHGDIHIFPLDKKIDMKKMERTVRMAQRSCLFVLDSGQENMLA